MKNRRLLSLGLGIVLAASVCGCSKTAETVEETTKEGAEETTEAAEIIEKAADRSTEGTAEKEETVYVNADAGGNVKNITVSSWLKNGEGAAEITDVTRLKDVVNVKGNETFTQNGDTYVWAAGGKDIYYQGKTSEELPVDVRVSYYLDGAEIDPEELAGKSGEVKIRFDYENRSMQKTEIGGKETELYVPFVAASTMVLDSSRFVNVEVKNGKILSDGKNTIVAGVAMPGLYASLDLLNLEGFEDIDIPEYVEVTADVTDFELSMTATILMPDVLNELSTDDLEGFDDLKDDIEELNDATYDLIDGCVELDDGVQELKDNMPELWDGAVKLDDGAVELNDGAWELDDGAQDLMDGAEKLNDGAKDIREGAKEVDQGTGTLKQGVGLLNDNMPKLAGGVNTLATGLQSLQNPMMLGPDGKSGDAEHPYIKASVGLLKNGVDTLVSGVLEMENKLEQNIEENQKKMQEAQNNVILLTGNLKKAVGEAEELQNQLKDLAEQMGMLPSESRTESVMVTEEAMASEEPDSVQTEEGTAELESGEKQHARTEPVMESSAESESDEEPSAGTEPVTESSAESESDEEQHARTETVMESSAESESDEGSSAGTETVTESSAETESDEEQQTEPESGRDQSVETKSPSISAEMGEEVPESMLEKESGEVKTSLPEAAEEEKETPEGSEEMEESEERSEFAESYLESLSESDGITSISMVQMENSGQRTDGTGASDLAAVIEVYKKVVKLQTELIAKMNEITNLQNQLREAAAEYAGLAGADTALRQIAEQLNTGDAAQLAQLSEGMADLEISVSRLYDGVVQINSQMGSLTTGAAELQQGVGSLKTGSDTLKAGTEKLYQGGIDLREGTKELYDGTQELKDGTEELKDGTQELKDGTQELKDGVVDLVDGADELKDGTEELLDGVHEYNDDGIQKLYDTVNVDLCNLLDRVDAISDLSEAYQSFSGKSEEMKGSVKFIIETEAIELNEEENK